MHPKNVLRALEKLLQEFKEPPTGLTEISNEEEELATYLKGPVPLVANSSPPLALGVGVGVGMPVPHMLQQLLDESGTVRHVILSPQPALVNMGPHYTNNPGGGQQQPQQPPHFYPAGGLPPGYPPPQHYGQVTPPLVGHGPPPPNHSGMTFMKDERTQRQYQKLKRKLEQKQKADVSGGNMQHGTPPSSPRKDIANGLRVRMSSGKQGGMSSVGTSEDGEESSSVQDEDDVDMLTEMLSTVQPPQVAELSSRSALLHWSCPEGLGDMISGDRKIPDYDISENDLRYEVLLSDKGKEAGYKSIFNGLSLSCRIQDLQPGKEYSVCLLVHLVQLDMLNGSPSQPTTFVTPACQPDPPQPPRIVQKTRTSLQLKWLAAADNGAPVQQYVLEWDLGQGNWTEVFRTRTKQHNLTKLQPATVYKFRLYAVNECGRSDYSEVVAYTTMGNAPLAPVPPTLRNATVNSLHLAWIRRNTDEEFVLQMDDRQTGHGFLPVFNGRDTQHICDKLRRNTEYRFRLRACNDEGSSRYSEEVCFRTLPGRPNPPHKPAVKGRIHAHEFRVKWDPPSDTGGAQITSYTLEMSTDKGVTYQTIYTGPSVEHLCDGLSPGCSFMLRVACASPGGRSDFSEACSVTTEAVCPGHCLPPRVHGKPRATSLTLKWSPPSSNGGSPVSQFEVDVTNNGNRRQAYIGKDTECTVEDLSPGQSYVFHLRACNRVGPGPWSEPFRVESGSAPPNVPQAPNVILPQRPSAGAMSVNVTWEEPANNGSPITDYQLQMASPILPSPSSLTASSLRTPSPTGLAQPHLNPASRPVSPMGSVSSSGSSGPHLPSPGPSSASPDRPASPARSVAVVAPTWPAPETVPVVSPTAASTLTATPSTATPSTATPMPEVADADVGEQDVLMERRVVYHGPALSYEVKNVLPATTYHFRVQAFNSSGWSDWSPLQVVTTPPAPPSAPQLPRCTATSTSLALSWSAPPCHGSPILRYQVDLGERSLITDATHTQLTVEQLKPQTQYRVRVRAVNSVGAGAYSPVLRCTTRPLPPLPPSLECISIGHNSLKLKWGDGRNQEFTHYTLEMNNIRGSKQFNTVYHGTNHSYKVNRLQELTPYKFRISATNDAGQGDFSQEFEFSTCIAPPPSLKPPKVMDIEQRSAVVEWAPCRPAVSDPILYQLQLSRLRNQEYKLVYRGSDTRAVLQDLDPGTEYSVRVCSVRSAPSGELTGAYSSPANLSTLLPDLPPAVTQPVVRQQVKRPKPISDQQWAAIILGMFSLFAILVAVIVHSVLE